jgi:hypothetical protein
MREEYKYIVTVGKINFTTLNKYLQNKLWTKIQSKRTDIAIFYSDYFKEEIICPLDRGFADYSDLMLSAVNKIAIVEKRPIEQIINDLLLPPSDVIRFRVDNKRTENGLISFSEGFALLENAKKSLLTTAYDILQPQFYHKKLSNKNAQQFIDSCYLGQTERGSFIASVVCPFINNTVDEKPSQLSLFNSEEELVSSFTRKVTKRYMSSLAKLKQVIERGDYSDLEKPVNATDIISANFIESIIELGEYGEKEQIEIQTSWSAITPEIVDIPKTITFTKDYIPPLESIAAKLKPKDEGKEGVFIGKISRAQADPDSSNRTDGEIMFNFLVDADKVIKAKVILNPHDFSQALDALDRGLSVRISGLLKTSGKSKVIENPVFATLE